MIVRRTFVALLACALACACGSNNGTVADGGAQGSPDGGDAGADDAGGNDAGSDAGPADAGSDGGSDAGSADAGSDAGSADAGSDASSDGGADAGNDGGSASLPSAPVLTVTTTLTEVHLSWTTPDDAGSEQFTVSRSDDDGSTFNPLDGAIGISGLSAIDTSAVPGIAWQYEVAATNDAGDGPESNIVIILAAPADLGAAGSDARLLLTWGPIENAASYDVYRVPASGAPALLGNTADHEYIDTNVIPGATYTYEVVSKAPSRVSSIASNQANAPALGIDITGTIACISDIGVDPFSAAELMAVLGLEAHVTNPDGSVTVYASVGTADNLLIPGVPAVPYAVTLAGESNFVVTSARTLDYSTGSMGRFDAFDTQDDGTTNDYLLTNLAPWQLGYNDPEAEADAGVPDFLEELSQGAGNGFAGLDTVTHAPDAGDTIFSGVETVADAQGDGRLVDATAGDVLYIWQLHTGMSGNGLPFQTAARAFADTSLVMQDMADNAVDGGMTTPAATNIPDIALLRSQWTAQLPQVNPAAQDRGESLYIEIEDKYAAYGWYGRSADALIYPSPIGTGDQHLGAVAWQNPIPPSVAWDPFVLLFVNSNIDFTVGAQTGSFQLTSQLWLPMGNSFDWTAGLGPQLSPPRAPKVNGADAFADQLNAADAKGVVTLSWSAPALGTPDFYYVILWGLDANAAVHPYATLATTATSAALTADLMPDTSWYFATIDAVIQRRGGSPLDITQRPFDWPSTYMTAELVTNKFARAGDPYARQPATSAAASVLEQRDAIRAEKLKRLPPALRRLATHHRGLPAKHALPR